MLHFLTEHVTINLECSRSYRSWIHVCIYMRKCTYRDGWCLFHIATQSKYSIIMGNCHFINSAGSTVCLLTHVLCKPTHFFFHSFIATMSYCLQTSLISAMKGWADKYHVWGTPTRSPFKVKLAIIQTQAFLHTKKGHIYTCSYTISVVYLCPIISCLKEFALFYHIPHTYGMHMSLKIY